jgi:UDP-glucose 4-epimerase
VSVLDDLSTGSRDNIEHLQGDPKFSFVLGTILDASTVDSLVSQCQMVYHLAAAVGVKYIIDNPLNSLRINIKGTENVFESANRHKRKVILASTSEIYGKNEKDRLSEDDDRILGSTAISRWGYSCTKAFDEFLALAYWREKKLPVVALRYFNVAGADPAGRSGQSTRNATHLIKVACEAALGERAKVDVYGTDYPTPDGTGIRDYIHVSDLVDAHLKALEYLRNGGQPLVANCGYGKGYSVLDVLEAVGRANGHPLEIAYGPRRAGDASFIVADSSLARRVFGWTPRHDDLDFIVKTALDWERRLAKGDVQGAASASA